MKANELRIGNIIWDKDKRILQVDSVAVGGINIIDSYDGYTFLYGEDDLTAIPLTEEWLLKFGFVKDGRTVKGKLVYKSPIGTGILYQTGNRFIWSNDDYNGAYLNITDCQHVHQLQNLYFALTGEELTIKKVATNDR